MEIPDPLELVMLNGKKGEKKNEERKRRKIGETKS
jgi:hypothetical protein